MPVIVCNFQMFDAAQTVILMEENLPATVLSYTVNEKLPEVIVNHCNNYGIQNVHLFGVTEYVENYGDQIKTIAKTKYSLDNINVELN